MTDLDKLLSDDDCSMNSEMRQIVNCDDMENPATQPHPQQVEEDRLAEMQTDLDDLGEDDDSDFGQKQRRPYRFYQSKLNG